MSVLFSLIVDNTNPRSLASRLRARRSVYLRRLIEARLTESPLCTIVDLGGTEDYWHGLAWFAPLAERLAITLVNAEGTSGGSKPPFRFVRADATDPALLPGQTFDISHSNSVIEHVGGWAKKQAFADNVKRLGQVYVVQTPNYWFPIEPHFFCPFIHWLPRPFQVYLLTRFALGWSKQRNTLEEAILRLESVSLLTRAEMRALFPDAEHHSERFFGLIKSFLAIGSGSSGRR